ncbi:MAG TPA: metal-sulfur cluster assembly factor [Deinococcales bacterium]|nr:metal-sulfur cluster assembly factor [Deinococcales bacterium]
MSTTQTEFVENDANVPARNIHEALRAVIDPELGIDIVALGMVYVITVTGGDVAVDMTLTTPGCPLHGTISADVENVLLQVPGVDAVTVELVWDPPWSIASMSQEAKDALGFW